MSDDTLRMPPATSSLDPAAVVVPAPEPRPVEPPPQQALPEPPEPSVVATADAIATTDLIVCPECGTHASVTLNHREATDFCQVCDYPLFWVPSRILMGRGGAGEASLRRLPGTSGRVTVASLPCPHCDEPNAVSAQTCVRCGRSLRPAPPPPPAPVVAAPPPEPEPEPEPEVGWAWWVWALLLLAGAATAAALAALVAVFWRS